MFEISFGAALEEPSSWKTFLNNAFNLIKLTKGENIIFTSGTDNYLFCWTPFDLVCLGISLGMTKEQAIKALTENCELAIAHGWMWKSFKAAAEIITEEELDWNPLYKKGILFEEQKMETD